MSEQRQQQLLELARKTPANLRYFFEQLDDPGWVEALRREGFFESPQPVERTEDDEGTWLRFPDWPQSRYLARVAAADPEQVAQTLLALPDTDNVRVHEDTVQAALAMPAEHADPLAQRELAWFRSAPEPLLNYPRTLADLAVSLLEQGRHQTAEAIIHALLAVHAADDRSSSRRQAASRLSDYEYGEVLAKVWPALLAHRGPKSIELLATRLDRVIELTMRDDGHDMSYIWRPAIEAHAQNVGRSLFDELIDAVRDMGEAAVSQDPEAVMAVLGSYPGPMFTRLRLHLLRHAGPSQNTEVAKALLDRDALEDPGLWHEYAQLLRAKYTVLPEDQRCELLDLITAGPEHEADDASDRGQGRRDYRRFKRLAMIAEHLDGETRADYDTLLDRFGPPDHPDFVAHHSSWSGPTSPLSGPEIAERGPGELLAYLREWQPVETQGPHASPEGLGRILNEVVAADPQPYASVATDFQDLDPTYVRALLDGLAAAVKEDRVFDWDRVLELAAWVLDQPLEEKPERIDMERDPGFGWSRKAVASLLNRGFEDHPGQLPPSCRDAAWELLSALAEDPDPRPSDEREEGGMDAATRSLNVTRGEAMHGVIRYLMWVERQAAIDFAGLGSVPEAKDVLERHLGLAHDPSLAVRAVYGMWLAQLVRMDEGWVAEHAGQIFPAAEAEHEHFNAAWHAYISFTRPWLGVLAVVEPAYELAVERLLDPPPSSPFAGHPAERLAEHLTWYAVMSAVPVEEPGLWQDFWSAADTQLRAHCVDSLGMQFEQAVEAPADVLDQAKRLWGWIKAHVEDRQRALVLSGFGRLLGSGVLDDRWLLDEALALLGEGIHLDEDFVVWRGLMRTAEGHPAETAAVLSMMIRTDTRGWSIHGSESELRTILERVIDSGDADARRRAGDAIGLLGARGMRGFRDLAERLGEAGPR